MKFEIKLEDLVRVDKNISVIIKKRKINELKKLVLQKFWSIRKFAKELSYDYESMRSFFNGYTNPPLNLFLKVTSVLNVNVNDFAERIIACNEPDRSFITISSFPIRVSKELANLVGHSFGDGHIKKDCFSYTNKSKELLNEVKNNAKKIGIKNIKVRKRYHKAWTITFPKLVRDLLLTVGAPDGNKTINKFELPNWILNGDIQIKKSFLKAMFDDESTVQIKSREIVLGLHKRIDLIENLEKFLENLKLLLQNFGLKKITMTTCHKKEGRNGMTLEKRLRICGNFNFINFSRSINFTNKTKREKIKQMIENVGNVRLQKGQAKEIIFDSLKAKGELDTIQIRDLLRLSHLATLNQLRKLEKENSIMRISHHPKPHLWMIKLKNAGGE